MTAAWYEGQLPEWLHPVAAAPGVTPVAPDDSRAYDWLNEYREGHVRGSGPTRLHSALTTGNDGVGRDYDVPDWLAEALKAPMPGITNEGPGYFNSMVGRPTSFANDGAMGDGVDSFLPGGRKPMHKRNPVPKTGASAMLDWINSGDAHGFPNKALGFQQFMGAAAAAANPAPDRQTQSPQDGPEGAQWSQPWQSGPNNQITGYDNQNHPKDSFGAFESGGGLKENHSVL